MTFTKSSNKLKGSLTLAILMMASLFICSSFSLQAHNGKRIDRTDHDRKSRVSERVKQRTSDIRQCIQEARENNPKNPSEEIYLGKRLTIAGQNIQDEFGNTILLRGVNFGFWGHTTEVDVAEFKATFPEANHVRLVIPWYNNGWDIRQANSPSTGHMTEEGLQILDDNINWLTSQGIWVNLVVRSYHGAGGGSQTNFFTTTDSQVKEEFKQLWQFIADRYKSTDYISMFEILSEPRQEFGVDVVRSFYKEVIDEVFLVDKNTPFVIGPAAYYNPENLVDGYYIDDEAYTDKIIYTVTHFKPHEYTHNVYKDSNPGPWYWGEADKKLNWAGLRSYFDNALAFRKKYNVPVNVNQAGAKAVADGYVQWTEALAGIMKNNKMHWTWWNWRGGDFDIKNDPELIYALQPFMVAN